MFNSNHKNYDKLGKSSIEISVERELGEFDRILQESSHKLDTHVACCGADGDGDSDTVSSVKIYRVVLRWLAMFNRIDLIHPSHQYYQKYGRKQQEQPTGPTTRAPIWPQVALVYYLYCCIKVTVNIYFQYVHDLNMYKFRTLKSIEPLPNGASDIGHIEAIEQKILWSKGHLDYIGAPYLELSFFVEIVYLYIYLLSFMTYYMGPIYLRFTPLYFRFAKVILDTEKEKTKCIDLTRQEIRRYLISCHEFRAMHTARLERTTSEQQLQMETKLANLIKLMNNNNKRNSNTDSNTGSKNNRHDILFDYSVQQLKLIASRGGLFPANWHRDLIERMSSFYLLYIVTCHVYGVILMAVFFLCMPMTGDLNPDQYTFSDYLMLFENLYTTLVLIVGISFYCSTVFTSCTDQILYIQRVRRLIDECTVKNKLKFNELNGLQSNGSIPSMQLLNCELKLGQMNSDLLLVFIQFRLLVDQLQREIKSYGMFGIVALVVIFSLPIMIRLHEPYLNRTTKMLQFCFFQATMIFLDCVLVPVCLVHNRTTDLYKSLSSLLAHTIETSSLKLNYCSGGGGSNSNKKELDEQTVGNETNGTTTVHLYNQHLVWLLRKELRYPDLFLRQFTTRIIGIKFTFQTLIKIHFWLGVLTLSFINGVTSGSGGGGGGGGGSGGGSGVNSLATFFNDPFNLYHS